MSFRVESGGLAEAEMKVVQESYTRRTQTHKRTRLTTSALPCRPFSAADGHSPPPPHSEMTFLLSGPSVTPSLLPSLWPACSTLGDPQRVLEHTVITTLTKRLLGNSCLQLCAPSPARKCEKRHCSLRQASMTAIKMNVHKHSPLQHTCQRKDVPH